MLYRVRRLQPITKGINGARDSDCDRDNEEEEELEVAALPKSPISQLGTTGRRVSLLPTLRHCRTPRPRPSLSSRCLFLSLSIRLRISLSTCLCACLSLTVQDEVWRVKCELLW